MSRKSVRALPLNGNQKHLSHLVLPNSDTKPDDEYPNRRVREERERMKRRHSAESQIDNRPQFGRDGKLNCDTQGNYIGAARLITPTTSQIRPPLLLSGDRQKG